MTQTTAPSLKRQFLLPDVGEGLTEGEVLRWLVSVGDAVQVNQPLVEVETAKAAVELPSPYAGTVEALHVAEGDVVPVGSPLVTLLVDAPAVPAASDAPTAAIPQPEGSGPVLVGYGVTPDATRRRPRSPVASPHGTQRPEAGPPGEPVKPVRHGGLEVGRAAEARLADEAVARPRAKPPVRKLARELGVDLATVRPTGSDGVVTRDDVEAAAALAQPLPLSGRADSREPVRGVTRLMAEAMTRSAFTIPHVTEWMEVDVTRSVELVDRLRATPAFEGVRVTPVLLVSRAVLAALARTPVANGWFDTANAEVVHRAAINLGFAAATPRGLVVPNIKGADRLSLRDLADALASLTATAKEGRTTAADLTGGTFTITNVGVFGVDGGTPIINPGESAILAVGAWREKPWVHRGQLAVRTVCTLALSFDHRFIDGATGSRLLVDVAAMLEEPAVDLAW
ncbi:MAG: dihydrolipoamide acetyltransferase family protein [Actinomycetes bacterium]